MTRYLLRRIGRSLLVFWLFLTCLFFFMQAIMPGDFAIMLGYGLGVEEVERIREGLGLNEPLWKRYLIWLGHILTGDLGEAYSLAQYNPVTRIWTQASVWSYLRFPLLFSCLVFGAGTAISFKIGEWLGKVTGWRRRRGIANIVSFIGVVLYAIFPPFLSRLLGELLSFLFQIGAQVLRATSPGIAALGILILQAVFPAQYALSRGHDLGLYFGLDHDLWAGGVHDAVWSPATVGFYMLITLVIVLVVLVGINWVVKRMTGQRVPMLLNVLFVLLVWFGGWATSDVNTVTVRLFVWAFLLFWAYVTISFGETMLIMQTGMADTLYEDYVLAARAKGLPERVVRDKHAARNALLPVLSRLIINVPLLLSGLVILEASVGVEGLGSALARALVWRDTPTVMGALLIIGLIALAARLVLDIVLGYLDPRIRIMPQGLEGPNQAIEAQVVHRSRLGTFKLNLWRLWRPRREPLPSLAARMGMSDVMAASDDRAGRGRRLRQMRLRAYQTRISEALRAFFGNWMAVLGVVLLVMFTLMAVIHPILLRTVWPRSVYDPTIGYDYTVLHPSPPSARHLLGTDALGRDVLSMLLDATPPTFVVAVVAAVTSAVVGTAFGAISAYYQGTVIDLAFEYLSDMFVVLPVPIFMLILGVRFPEVFTPFRFGLTYGLMAGASSVAVVMRSQALKLLAQPFISAAKVAGASDRRIMVRHLVPYMLPLAAVQMMLAAVGAVIVDGFITFTGATEFRMNWGGLAYYAWWLSGIIPGAAFPWHQLIAPSVALSLFAAAFYFVSRGLHAVAEPRLRRR